MESDGLSQRERTILTEIEQDLRADAVLERRLRTMRRGARPWAGPRGAVRAHRTGVAAALLACMSFGLFLAAVSTASPALVWAFALTWAGTLACLVTLVRRWCRKLAAALEARPRPTGENSPD
ncbi:DUF3040 domain-containing protein [Streptomyces sp. NPDC051211]|uniref:DUF3040 domain-containing protein n=1 Tax=Streptomyces sp. NPDC051211 TaxID=3154643 RepID=UPI00345110BD